MYNAGIIVQPGWLLVRSFLSCPWTLFQVHFQLFHLFEEKNRSIWFKFNFEFTYSLKMTLVKLLRSLRHHLLLNTGHIPRHSRQTTKTCSGHIAFCVFQNQTRRFIGTPPLPAKKLTKSQKHLLASVPLINSFVLNCAVYTQ